MLSSVCFVDTTLSCRPALLLGLPPIDRSWNDPKSVVDPPTGVPGLLLDCSFFLASIVALFSHCDSAPSPPSSPAGSCISGRSRGTLSEVGSAFFKCRRSDNLLELVGFVLDLWLARDETEAVEFTEPLLERPLNSRLVFDSLRESAKGGGSGVL